MEKVEFGDIRTIDRIPEVFKDESIRGRTAASLDRFKGSHGGKFPQKFQIAQFIFDRDEQICTADSRNKYLAWSASDLELAADILSQINPEERSVVLRSNMMDVPDDNPVLQITKREDIDDFVAYVNALKGNADKLPKSKIWDEFFEKVKETNKAHTGKDTLDDTVVQILTNITDQKGLFLVRPTFIYDTTLRDEIKDFEVGYDQKGPDFNFRIDNAPEAFVGFRILPIGEFAREKKTNLGYMFVYNPQTHQFEIRSGFPNKTSNHDARPNPIPREELGRSVDFDNNNQTTFNYRMGDAEYSLTDISGLEALSLDKVDLDFLQHVLEWQLPRIFRFESEIRQQEWIDQGESTTHQLVIFPPQHLGDRRINTQYFDFHPYASHEQLEEKAQDWHKKQFDDLSTEEKVITFF